MTKKLNVSGEIAPLKRVIIHRPDEGISRISPRRAEELLFDDIVHLPQMQEEHDIFTDLLRHFLGKENVLETEDLLVETIRNDEETTWEAIDKIFHYEDLPDSFKSKLRGLSPEKMAKVLITGYVKDEDFYLFDPIPNFIFTRDIAVTVNDHVVITKAAKTARARENFLTRLIFHSHPDFAYLKKENKLINLNDLELFPPARNGEQVTVEGGDMMILNQNYLLIGCSERSTAHAIHSLKNALFERKTIKNVVQINIPNDRSYMHIDTIFTQIHNNHIVAFKPIVVDGMSSNVEVHRDNGTTDFYGSVRDFIKSEINPKMEFILSGGGQSPWQEREQWTDGCNLVALKPGVGFTYDRNPKTGEEFRKFGYKIADGRELLEAFRTGTQKPEDIENTIINLPSNELSRARGGSHCMTCPIERL